MFALLTPIVFYLFICLLIYVFQRSLIYFPTPPLTNALAGTFELQVPGATLRVAYRPNPGSKAILYFGGNAEQVAQNEQSLVAAFPDYAIYMLNYRGYSGSSGIPSEAALISDAIALFDWVKTKHSTIAVIGRSLGSGVAIQLAAQRPVSRLALVTPFDSLQNLAKKQFPFLPVGLLLKDKFESWKYAPGITIPTLLLVADLDEIIPRASSEVLFAKFPSGVAKLKSIALATHNSISDHADYSTLLKSAITGF